MLFKGWMTLFQFICNNNNNNDDNRAEMAAENTSTRRRVKLYMLNENRAWDDNGTGHVSVTYSEKPKFMMLDVKSEIDGEAIVCLL